MTKGMKNGEILEYKIEKNIPIPLRGGESSPFPFSKMEIGDSFLIPINQRSKMQSRLYKYLQENKDKAFISRRTDDNNVRVWRIKPSSTKVFS